MFILHFHLYTHNSLHRQDFNGKAETEFNELSPSPGCCQIDTEVSFASTPISTT